MFGSVPVQLSTAAHGQPGGPGSSAGQGQSADGFAALLARHLPTGRRDDTPAAEAKPADPDAPPSAPVKPAEPVPTRGNLNTTPPPVTIATPGARPAALPTLAGADGPSAAQETIVNSIIQRPAVKAPAGPNTPLSATATLARPDPLTP